MTTKEKLEWLETASNEELLDQLVRLEKENKYGSNSEDIRLTKAEILRRMGK